MSFRFSRFRIAINVYKFVLKYAQRNGIIGKSMLVDDEKYF